MPSHITHIAFADDDKDDQDLLQEAVAGKCPDIHFTLADDGDILLEKLKSPPPPDFIILDINMPRLNGLECLKAIRKKRLMKEIPVMIYSTSSNEKDIEEAFLNGANFYVIKPGSIEAIDRLAADICTGSVKSSLGTY